MSKLGTLPQVSWTFLPIFFPECMRNNVNQMRKVQEAGLTDLENQMEQAEFAAGHLIDVEIAIDSLLLKRKQQGEEVKFANELKRAESIIPLSCRHQSFDQSPWGTPQWEATPPRCCWRPQQETASTALQWWWHGEDWTGTSSNRDVRHLSDAWQWIPSSRRDPKTQRRKRTPSAYTASADADQKWDTPPTCASTHFPYTPCTCQPAHATRQKWQQGTPNYPLQPQLIRALLPRV